MRQGKAFPTARPNFFFPLSLVSDLVDAAHDLLDFIRLYPVLFYFIFCYIPTIMNIVLCNNYYVCSETSFYLSGSDDAPVRPGKFNESCNIFLAVDVDESLVEGCGVSQQRETDEFHTNVKEKRKRMNGFNLPYIYIFSLPAPPPPRVDALRRLECFFSVAPPSPVLPHAVKFGSQRPFPCCTAFILWVQLCGSFSLFPLLDRVILLCTDDSVNRRAGTRSSFPETNIRHEFLGVVGSRRVAVSHERDRTSAPPEMYRGRQRFRPADVGDDDFDEDALFAIGERRKEVRDPRSGPATEPRTGATSQRDEMKDLAFMDRRQWGGPSTAPLRVGSEEEGRSRDLTEAQAEALLYAIASPERMHQERQRREEEQTGQKWQKITEYRKNKLAKAQSPRHTQPPDRPDENDPLPHEAVYGGGDGGSDAGAADASTPTDRRLSKRSAPNDCTSTTEKTKQVHSSLNADINDPDKESKPTGAPPQKTSKPKKLLSSREQQQHFLTSDTIGKAGKKEKAEGPAPLTSKERKQHFLRTDTIGVEPKPPLSSKHSARSSGGVGTESTASKTSDNDGETNTARTRTSDSAAPLDPPPPPPAPPGWCDEAGDRISRCGNVCSSGRNTSILQSDAVGSEDDEAHAMPLVRTEYQGRNSKTDLPAVKEGSIVIIIIIIIIIICLFLLLIIIVIIITIIIISFVDRASYNGVGEIDNGGMEWVQPPRCYHPVSIKRNSTLDVHLEVQVHTHKTIKGGSHSEEEQRIFMFIPIHPTSTSRSCQRTYGILNLPASLTRLREPGLLSPPYLIVSVPILPLDLCLPSNPVGCPASPSRVVGPPFSLFLCVGSGDLCPSPLYLCHHEEGRCSSQPQRHNTQHLLLTKYWLAAASAPLPAAVGFQRPERLPILCVLVLLLLFPPPSLIVYFISPSVEFIQEGSTVSFSCLSLPVAHRYATRVSDASQWPPSPASGAAGRSLPPWRPPNLCPSVRHAPVHHRSHHCCPPPPLLLAVPAEPAASFTPSSTDLHAALLLEAFEKHGVDRNVPPQLPPALSPNPCFPDGAVPEGPDPPADPVPTPRYPPGLAERMATADGNGVFLYSPTYDPPPLKTTGSRSLADLRGRHAAGQEQTAATWVVRHRRALALRNAEWAALWRAHGLDPGDGSSPSPAEAEASEPSGAGSDRPAPDGPSRTAPTAADAVLRAAVNPEMKYHCSVCGRGYRQRQVAAEHVLLRHRGSGGAVLEGPGPGELLAVVTDVSAPRPSASATASATATASTARATPEGAAPSLKRRLTTVGVATRPGSGRDGSRALSVKESSKLYPNPFGAAADAAAEAAKLEEREPVNPFVGETPVRRGAEGQRRLHFSCPLCSRCGTNFSCRVLDRLLDHLEEAHAAEGGVDAVHPHELQRLYDQQAKPWRHVAGGDVPSPTAAGGPPSKRENGSGAPSAGGADAAASAPPPPPSLEPLPEGGARTANEPLQSEEPLRLHARLPSNAVLRGCVADVQHGFSGKRLIFQCVLELADEDAQGPDQREFVVVRYLGEASSCTALRAAVHVGSDVVVSGLLRLDRRIDSCSKRSHAYPMVVVVPPFGFVRAL
eukprot:gene6240-4490_t